MSLVPSFFLGAYRTLSNPPSTGQAHLPAHHCCTHVVSFGASGSGKTGLSLVMVEEALRSGIPVLMIDVKGDLPNLLLRFPQLTAEALLPWVENAPPTDLRPPLERAQALVDSHRKGLQSWDLTEAAVGAYVTGSDIRVITPG